MRTNPCILMLGWVSRSIWHSTCASKHLVESLVETSLLKKVTFEFSSRKGATNRISCIFRALIFSLIKHLAEASSCQFWSCLDVFPLPDVRQAGQVLSSIIYISIYCEIMNYHESTHNWLQLNSSLSFIVFLLSFFGRLIWPCKTANDRTVRGSHEFERPLGGLWSNNRPLGNNLFGGSKEYQHINGKSAKHVRLQVIQIWRDRWF